MHQPKRYKVILSQVIASLAQYVLLAELGMAVCFPTIVVPALLRAEGPMSMNETQASWFGCIIFLLQPLGSVVSGPLLDRLGRKRAILLFSLPHAIAWITSYLAQDVPTLFLAAVLFGVGTGLQEAPSVTYMSEISQPSLRGVLVSISPLSNSVGICMIYFLGTLFDWKTASLISFSASVLIAVIIFWVPETPIWLISKGKNKEALKSLCWLRGWCKSDQVMEEYQKLVKHDLNMIECSKCIIHQNNTNFDIICEHGSKTWSKELVTKTKLLFEKETFRPLSLMILFFTFYAMSGLSPISPNMVNVCDAFGMNADPYWITTAVGACIIIGGVTCVLTIKTFGKRKLAIFSIFSTSLSCLSLGVYAFIVLPSNVSSYDVSTFPKERSYIPIVLFIIMVFFNSVGINSIPWALLSEVFPFKTRGYASGIAAAFAFVALFVGAKTNINVEKAFGIDGSFYVYSIFAFFGGVYLYLYLPETENKTLKEIEKYFSGDQHRIFADDFLINCILRRNFKETLFDTASKKFILDDNKKGIER